MLREAQPHLQTLSLGPALQSPDPGNQSAAPEWTHLARGEQEVETLSVDVVEQVGEQLDGQRGVHSASSQDGHHGVEDGDYPGGGLLVVTGIHRDHVGDDEVKL